MSFVFAVIVHYTEDVWKKKECFGCNTHPKKDGIYTASICLMIHVSWSTEKILDSFLNDRLIVTSTPH